MDYVIERYTLPDMGRVWAEAHKYELWCRVETLVLAAHAQGGTVPADSVAAVRAAPPPAASRTPGPRRGPPVGQARLGIDGDEAQRRVRPGDRISLDDPSDFVINFYERRPFPDVHVHACMALP